MTDRNAVRAWLPCRAVQKIAATVLAGAACAAVPTAAGAQPAGAAHPRAVCPATY